ncbi:MAG: phage major capsid protein [Oscillospiraceae bacterium]|jgi:HK97 family phage major capsid protein|nr:phage major capsid protein [Oscillospiraceae bacterium]
MKTLATAPRYHDAFWNLMKHRPFDATDLNGGRRGHNGSQFLPMENVDTFRKYQAEQNIFRKIARNISTDSTACRVKAVLPSGAAAIVEENDAIPDYPENTAVWPVQAYKIGKIAKMSDELLADAGFDIADALAADFGIEFGKVEENVCINGSGTDEPFGLPHDVQGAEIGATATAGITLDNVNALYFSLAAECCRNAVWLMSDETALRLRSLKDSGGAYLWNAANDTLLGKPVYTSPYMPSATAGNKPILFGNFDYYWFIERGGVSLSPLRELYAEHGITGFIGMEFIDGKLIKRDAVKALLLEDTAE